MGNLTQGVRGVATNGNAFGITRCEVCNRPHLGRCGPSILVSVPELSYRENQIVYLLCEGMSNVQMAEELGLSEETIKRHLTNIFDVSGKENRLQVAMYYSNGTLRARIEQMEADLAALKLKYETELQQERHIAARLEMALQRERRITDAFTKKQNGGASKTTPGTNNPRVRHWLRPAQ